MRTNSDALAEWAARHRASSASAASGPTPDATDATDDADSTAPALFERVAGLPIFDGEAIQHRLNLDRDDVQYISTVLAMAVTVSQALDGSGSP